MNNRNNRNAELAFLEELLPTGNRLIKKCPLMTSLERMYHCLHTCEGLLFLYHLLLGNDTKFENSENVEPLCL